MVNETPVGDKMITLSIVVIVLALLSLLWNGKKRSIKSYYDEADMLRHQNRGLLLELENLKKGK